MRLLVFAFVTLFVGCSTDNRRPLERSCAGEVVGPCAPYAYAEIVEAELTPTQLSVGNFDLNAQVHVRLTNCGANTPVGHAVHMQALVMRSSSLDDAGTSTMVFDLGTVYDDGTSGDAVAMDGMIDVTIPNPFSSEYPPNTEITIRFTPRASLACEGTSLEVPYEIGPRFSPP